MKKELEEISAMMVDRYSNRYRKLGYNVHTLGWGSKEQQEFRFRQTLAGIEPDGEKTLLDIGCGFGDYFSFLTAENLAVKKYLGWDINPDLIAEAAKIWESNPVAEFNVVNISAEEPPAKADIAIMLGLLNLNLQGKVDNYEYSFGLIKNAFACVNEVLVVDFLSAKLTPDYPKEDFVFYHEPAKMLEFALTLSPNVVLKHNYAPIPQKEFMLFIYQS